MTNACDALSMQFPYSFYINVLKIVHHNAIWRRLLVCDVTASPIGDIGGI